MTVTNEEYTRDINRMKELQKEIKDLEEKKRKMQEEYKNRQPYTIESLMKLYNIDGEGDSDGKK